MADPPEPPSADAADVSRRTWLAAERTWLAWWRTGLGAAAVAIAVGRLLPSLAGGARWPYRVLGLGYGALGIALLLVGAVRQQHLAQALRQGDYDELSTSLVMWLTAAAVGLSTVTLTILVVSL